MSLLCLSEKYVIKIKKITRSTLPISSSNLSVQNKDLVRKRFLILGWTLIFQRMSGNFLPVALKNSLRVGKDMIKNLSRFESDKKPIVVMDAGIATEDNITWLKENGYDYIVVSRKKQREIPANIEMVTVKEDEETGKPIVQVGIVKKEGSVGADPSVCPKSDEVKAYCHSILRQKKEDGIRGLFHQRFEEELKKAREALSAKNGTKQYEKVIERIGRLKERYKRVASTYEVEITKDDKTNKATSVKWQQNEQEETSGVYCLRVSRCELKEKEIWSIYTMLTQVEAAFRCMKSELGMRPVCHSKEDRVDGHLFITVLGYHVLQAIRFKLKNKEIRES